jgi:hypothetical protein
VAAQVENGAGAELGPAATSAFHAMLDEVLRRSFDGTGADRQVLGAYGRVLHAIRVGAEIATLSLQDNGRVGSGRLRGIEPLQRDCWPGRPEMVEGNIGPLTVSGLPTSPVVPRLTTSGHTPQGRCRLTRGII